MFIQYFNYFFCYKFAFFGYYIYSYTRERGRTMVNNSGKGYYEDISDDLLYVSQSISQKISSEEFNLSDEKEIIKDILEKLESQSSE